MHKQFIDSTNFQGAIVSEDKQFHVVGCMVELTHDLAILSHHKTSNLLLHLVGNSVLGATREYMRH